jgi:hypothetical protein
MATSGRRRREVSLWPLALVLLIGALLVGGAIFAASRIGGASSGTPAATASPTMPTFPPTTRDPHVAGGCASATKAVAGYVLGEELHGKLPLADTVPTAEYEKPAFHALLISSLDNCASRTMWLRAFTDYAVSAMGQRILSHACGLEAVRGTARSACR